MTQTAPKKRISLSGWIVRICIGFLAIVIVGLVALWAARKSLTERAVLSWCEGRGLSCAITVEALGTSSARISGFKIDSGEETPFQARAIDLTYGFAGLTRVRIDTVTLDRPVIRGELTDEGLGFFGLETLYERDDDAPGSSDPSPTVTIDEGYAYLRTAAGEVSAQFAAGGRLIEDGFVKVQIEPASLRHEAAYLDWSRGDIDLQFERGAVTGLVDIAIEQAELGALSAQMAQINADITDGDDALRVVMSGSAQSISQGDRRGAGIGVDLVGHAVRPAAGDAFDVLGALRSLTLDVRAQTLVDGANRLGEVQLVADLTADARALSGPVGFEAQDVSSKLGEIGGVSLSGDLSYRETDTGSAEGQRSLEYDGKLVLRNADGSKAGLAAVIAPEELPSVLQPHARRMKRVLLKALGDFDFGASFVLEATGARWAVRAAEPVLLQAASGLKLAIDPLAGQAWLELGDGALTMSGLVRLEGAGGPDFQTYLNDVTWRDGVLEIAARDGVLEAWSVEGSAISAQYGGMVYRPGQGGRFFIDGEVAVAGALAGVELEKTRLFGKIEGAQGPEGWRVQTAGSQCVGLTMGKAQTGTVTLEPVAVALCPVDGRFVRQEEGKTVGRINLGDIKLAFSTIDSSGVFSFAGAKLDWVSDGALSLTVRGDSLALPMRIGEHSLVIASTGPSVSAIIGDGPLQILAQLDDTQFTGNMVPAKVRADAFSFDGLAADAGFEGKLHGAGVHISDLEADALYEPIVTDLDGVLRDGAIRLTGALLTEKTQVAIADFRMVLDLTELNGTANLDMRPITFERGRFQPTALSEKLRGVMTNARGSLDGKAAFVIREGALEGSGEIVLQDVSFDTFKAGTVTGVNGRIAFQDILELRSEPHQVFTIAGLNPGVPLDDGLVQFQLNGADEVRLEAARWPFAGGQLRVRPTVWTVNGENEAIMVEVEAIGLADLVETLKVPDLVAEGTVSGAFPIEFEGANIMVRNAVLTADERGGTIGYTGSATAPVEGQNALADYAFDALKNFDFTVMRLGLEGNLIGRLLLSIDLTGHNDDVLDGKAFKFGISIDSELLPLLTSLRNVPTESFVSEALALEREARDRARVGE